jgi:hypothetical protein
MRVALVYRHMSLSSEGMSKEAKTMRLKNTGVASIAAVMCMSGALLFFSPGSAGAATTGDREALADAQQYLSSQAFSFQGLISQVEFDGFSKVQATYGVAHSGANWNKEALLSAKDYLSTQAFSRGSLISQLEFDKFTPTQATYGVARCGANWNTEAYKDAKEYMSQQAFSLSGLISQLEFDKFTAAQASYGAHKAY